MKKDLKLFEIRGDLYAVQDWYRDNPDFVGPPNWFEVHGGWFVYHIIATDEEDAKQGAMKYQNRFSPPMFFREEHDFYFKKPKLIEWISYITDEAKKNIAP